MGVELVLAPEVEQDLSEAYAWYESRRVGLGEEFLTCVQVVTVYGVFHTAQDPGKWRQRLP